MAVFRNILGFTTILVSIDMYVRLDNVWRNEVVVDLFCQMRLDKKFDSEGIALTNKLREESK